MNVVTKIKNIFNYYLAENWRKISKKMRYFSEN